MGPEGARVLHHLAKREASWQEGDLRSLRQSELLENVGLALMRQVWKLLPTKPPHSLKRQHLSHSVLISFLKVTIWAICSRP